MRFVLFIAIIAPALLAQTKEPTDWRFAHPDATLVGAIHPRAILDSPYLGSAIAEASQKEPAAAAMIAGLQSMLRGVTEIRFSVMDNGTPEPDVIALVSGTLDESLASLLSQNKAKARRIDETTLLLGNGDALERAAARMNATAARFQSRALDGIETLQGFDIWVSGKLPARALTGFAADEMKGISLGLSAHDSLDMEVNVQLATAAAAQALVQLAHSEEAKLGAQFAGMLKSFVDGPTAHFRLSVPREKVVAAMQARQNEPQPLTPPQRRSIVIQGLDEGTKEIPLK